MTRLCVFCGSSPGRDGVYAGAARALGEAMAAAGVGLVFGGGHVGLMGVLADTVLAAGGHAIGVIPDALVAREIAHRGLPDLRVVHTMHERKALMADLADAFVAMPGGMGTLDEFFEIWTWAQLGIHRKPCGLFNAAGYFDGLLAFVDHAIAEGFAHASHREMLIVDADAARLLSRLQSAPAPALDKWGPRPQA